MGQFARRLAGTGDRGASVYLVSVHTQLVNGISRHRLAAAIIVLSQRPDNHHPALAFIALCLVVMLRNSCDVIKEKCCFDKVLGN